MARSPESTIVDTQIESSSQQSKREFLIYPERGLSSEEQSALATKICDILAHDTELETVIAYFPEGVTFWVASITTKEGENIQKLPNVCLYLLEVTVYQLTASARCFPSRRM
jgi:hypothetical protein